MQPQQALIRLRRGRIAEVVPRAGEVRICTEAWEHVYPEAWVLPGFVDAHGHLVHLGLELQQPRLHHCRSAQECVEALRTVQPNRGEWLVASGWNHEHWEPPQLPTAALLDELFPDLPVVLRRVDGHALWVNSAALRRAGISASTPDPPGGWIVRTRSGAPTGVLVDAAMEPVLRLIPEPTPEQLRQAILQAASLCLQYGITEVHDMDVAPEWVPLFHELAEAGQLPIRVQSYVRGQRGEWDAAGLLPTVGEFFRLRGVKFYADGALGSYGAALLEPYADRPEHRGLLLWEPGQLERAVRRAVEAGWHIAIHAIGEAANRMVVQLYWKLRQERILAERQLLRVEHAQVVHPEDLEPFAESGAIASVQPIHCLSDAAMAQKRLGAERTAWAYRWRSLLQVGIPLAAGSDFPIESPDPRLGIAAFCFRQPPHWEHPWHPEECLEMSQALQAYTIWAHLAADTDERRGLLLPGYDADLVVVDRNLAAAQSPEEIAATRILAVYVAGIRRFAAIG
jgi:predicted amidohydrolase YtcJ